MKKFRIVIIFLLCAVIGFSVTFLVRQQQQQAERKLPIQQVSILKEKVVPDFVTLHPGEYVQFNSKDGRDHVMAQGSDETGESPVIHPDEGYRVQFKKTGTFEFHDKDNPDAIVTVLVYNEDKKKK